MAAPLLFFAACDSPSYPHLVRSPFGPAARTTAQPLLLSARSYYPRLNQNALISTIGDSCYPF
jgi:hypothetical protein